MVTSRWRALTQRPIGGISSCIYIVLQNVRGMLLVALVVTLAVATILLLHSTDPYSAIIQALLAQVAA